MSEAVEEGEPGTGSQGQGRSQTLQEQAGWGSSQGRRVRRRKDTGTLDGD